VVRVRPLELGDLERVQAVDAASARATRRPPVATRGALSFYARTGHAFVAEDDSGARGFALAQAVWDGTRPTVRLRTLAVAESSDAEARAALLEAVTKSAYDAAVYDLICELPEGDDDARDLLAAAGWSLEPVRLYGRTLGSRGAA